jgi:DNA repair photolyase
MLRVKEIQAKSILNKSKIFDYCVNPYTGCQIACPYCYARLFMRRYSGHEEAWGDFVDIKVNASEILKRQLERAKRGKVWVSSVCDPYQLLEKKYRLTRRCLEELWERQFPLNLQTKSALVVRDLDLLKRFEEAEVGFTITTNDEAVARLFEPRASSVADRMDALEKIHSQGVKTFVFIGPILPGDPHLFIRELAGKVDRVYIDRMNYMSSIRGFYHKHGLKDAASDDFFQKYKNLLVGELRRYQIPFDVFF